MKLNLKYTALKVDEIEKAKGTAIENCISDTTVANLCLFVQKGRLFQRSRGASSLFPLRRYLRNGFGGKGRRKF